MSKRKRTYSFGNAIIIPLVFGVWGGVPQYQSRVNVQQKCLQHFTDVHKTFLLNWFWRTSHIVIIINIGKNFTIPLLPHSGSHQRIQQTFKKSKENTVALPTYKNIPYTPTYIKTWMLWCDVDIYTYIYLNVDIYTIKK